MFAKVLSFSARISLVESCALFFLLFGHFSAITVKKEVTSMRNLPQIDSKEIGKRLRSLMMQQGLTVKELQKLLALSCPQTIYHWLNGDSMPTIDHLYSLCCYFEISVDEFLFGSSKLT